MFMTPASTSCWLCGAASIASSVALPASSETAMPSTAFITIAMFFSDGHVSLKQIGPSMATFSSSISSMTGAVSSSDLSDTPLASFCNSITTVVPSSGLSVISRDTSTEILSISSSSVSVTPPPSGSLEISGGLSTTKFPLSPRVGFMSLSFKAITEGAVVCFLGISSTTSSLLF
uniref:Secreted protein n=1 Tax=Arundo donax TaxID=35708 RepID=A0A0A9CZ53_ARUDO